MSNEGVKSETKQVVVFVKSSGTEPLLGHGCNQNPNSPKDVCDQCPLRAGELAIDGVCTVPSDTKAAPGSIKAGLKRVPLHVLQLAGYGIDSLSQDQDPPTCFHPDRWDNTVQTPEVGGRTVLRFLSAGILGQISCKFVNSKHVLTHRSQDKDKASHPCPKFMKCEDCPARLR